MEYLQLIGGLIVLVAGGELLVRGSVSIARQLRVSPLVIGLTVVAFGTSTPELVVSVGAVVTGSSGVAVGTIVGSNIANVLLVLGLPAMIYSADSRISSVVRDVDLMLAASFLMLFFAIDGQVERWQGGVLFGLLLAYLVASIRQSRGRPPSDSIADYDDAHPAPHGLATSLMFVPAGVAALWAGSYVLLPAAVAIAIDLGVSEKVVGAVMVGVGTSFPELTTSVVAAIRRHGDVAIGNVVGSNLFNILGVLGVTAIVAPVPVGLETLRFDIWVMIATSLLLIPFALRRRALGRIGGIVFFGLFIAYITAELLHAPGWAVRNWPL